MDSVVTNNAAYRLLQILTAAQAQADNKQTKEVWMSVLKVEPKTIENLFEKLILLRGLADETKRLIEEHQLPEIHATSFDNILSAINFSNLNAQWVSFKQHLSKSDVLTRLEFTSHELSKKIKEESISEEEILAFLKKLDKFIEKTHKSNINSMLKQLVLKQLDDIRSGVSNYRILGVHAIKEAYEHLLVRWLRTKASLNKMPILILVSGKT